MFQKSSSKKTIAIGLVGNILEWYDLTLYGYLAPLIAQLFFPNNDPTISILSTLSVFALGFLIRPLGALLFGYIGDHFGRKHALYISMLMVAFPTFFIGLLPTYHQIGLFAPLLLILLRLMQGLSAGGEFSMSLIFLTEHAPEDKKGFFGSWVFFGSGIGWLLGSGVCAALSFWLSKEELLAWGWRIPFLLGLIAGFFGAYIRTYAQETAVFTALSQDVVRKDEKHFYKEQRSLAAFIRPCCLTMGYALFSTIGGYILYAYMPFYLNQSTGIPLKEALLLNTLSLILFTILVPVAGWLSDYIGKKKLLMASTLGIITLGGPLFSLLQSGYFFQSLLALSIFSLLMALFQGPFPAVMHELFPPRIRATGVAFGYNMAAALFAGTTPMLCAFFINQTGNVLAPAYYLIFAASITFLVILSQKQIQAESRAY